MECSCEARVNYRMQIYTHQWTQNLRLGACAGISNEHVLELVAVAVVAAVCVAELAVVDVASCHDNVDTVAI